MSASQVFIFGPQCLPTAALCQTLLERASTSPLLSTFLQLVADALLEDVDALDHPDLECCPPRSALKSFTTISTYHERTGYTNAALNGAIVATSNTGFVLEGEFSGKVSLDLNAAASDSLYIFVQSAIDQDKIPVDAPNEQIFAGYCTGILTALSIACAGVDQPMEILTNAVEAVRIAFFVGLRGQQSAKHFSDPMLPVSQQPWSVGINGADFNTVQGWVQAFNATNKLDEVESLCVSAVTSAVSLTVSGPPEYLDQFVKLQQGPMASTSGILFNAFHIYSSYHNSARGASIKEKVKHDIKLRQIRFDHLSSPKKPVVSSKDGSLIILGGEGGDLLDQALDLMLVDVCRWDLVSKQVIQTVASHTSTKIDIFASAFSMAIARDMWSQLRKTVKYHSGIVISDLSAPARNEHLGSVPKTVSPHKQEEIVVVSMACRFPGGADTPEKYWDLLNSGKSAIAEIPKSRFDIDAYFGTGRNQTQVRHMGAVENLEYFDCRLFNISPKEAEQKDPGHRLMTLACYEALEQAGYVPNVCPTFDTKRIGCFMGASSDDYRENASSNISSYFITGNIRAFIPGAITYGNRWEGPSNSIDTGDSSSTAAIEHAVNALRAHQCDSALAGGVTILTQPQMFIGMDKDGLLSHSGKNASFTSANDGAVRGDGVGVLLLKRLSDALAEGDNILATISDVTTSFSGPLSDKDALNEVFRRTCQSSGVKPDDVIHVEASGHHTVDGERSELEAIVETFGKGKAISVGSVRPNIGACEAASGIASVIKAILMLKNGSVPPALSATSGEMIPEAQAWINAKRLSIGAEAASFDNIPAAAGPNAAIVVSDRSLQRGNTVLVVKRPPQVPEPTIIQTDDRMTLPFTLSAKTPKGLEQTRQRYIQWLESGAAPSLSDLSMTMTARRITYPHRICFSASSHSEVFESLKSAKAFEQAKKSPSINLVFDGTPLGDGFRQFVDRWPTASFILKRLSDTCLSLGVENSASISALTSQLLLVDILKTMGVQPTSFTARGLGAFSALVAADSIDVCQAIVLVNAITESKVSPAIPGISRATAVAIELSDGFQIPAGSELVAFWERLIKQVQSESSSEVAGSVQLSDMTNAEGEEEAERIFTDAVLSLYQDGCAISWVAFHADYLGRHRLVKTPTYAFDVTRYWIEYQDRNLIQKPLVVEEEEMAASEAYSDEEEYEEDDEDLEDDNLTSPRFPLLARCVEFELDDNQGMLKAVYETPIASEPSFELVCGHLVHGRGLVPATMWAEMALEVAHDLESRTGVADDANQSAFDVRDLTIFNSLSIVKDDEESYKSLDIVVEVKGSLNLQQGLTVTFKSRKTAGAKLTDHLSCTVHRASESDWSRGWKKLEHLIDDRIETIKEDSSALGTRTAYRIFEVVVSYAAAYQGMKTVYLNHESYEATTEAVLDSSAPSTNFVVNPCLMDSLGQITGFISNVAAAEAGSVFIANSIESMRFTDAFRKAAAQPGFRFRTYCKMTPVNDFMVGNMLVLDQQHSQVIACMNGVRFRRVPLRVLQVMLPHPSKAKAETKVPVRPKPTPLQSNEQKKLAAAATKVQEVAKPALSRAEPALATSKLWDDVVSCISGELGVASSELKPDTSFTDMGLDSLMSMVIIGSLRNILPADVELPNSLFLENDTPSQLRTWMESAAPQVTGSSQPIPTVVETEPVAVHPTATSKVPKSSSTSSPMVWTEVMDMIASELGVEVSELKPETSFADIGLDSLMSMVIIGSLRNVIPTEVDLPNSLFLDYDTPEQLKTWLASVTSSAAHEDRRDSAISIPFTTSSSISGHDSSASSEGCISSSTSVSGDYADRLDSLKAAVETPLTPPEEVSMESRASKALETTIEVLSCELGIDTEVLTIDAELSALGLDSLMSLVVIGSLQEKLPFTLPSNAFLENDTLRDLMALYSKLEEETFGVSPQTQKTERTQLVQNEAANPTTPLDIKKPVLLQPGSDTVPALFLAPDGSGSCAVYSSLPKMDRKVFGFNSPFSRDAEAWTGGMNQLVDYYMASMKMVQPEGPYVLGGWSFGGIIMYELGRKLSLSADPNDRASHLVMFDSPSPTCYPALPVSVTDWLFKADVFKGVTPPQLSPQMVEHMKLTVEGLDAYKPIKYENKQKTPKAFIISAIQGLGQVKGVKEKNRTVEWLLESRANLGTGGWEALMENIQPLTIEANHFDMMQKPKIDLLGAAILKALQA